MINPPENQLARLSPLDQIRQTEAEVTRSIAQARQEAERAIKQEKMRIKDLIAEARETGRREGQAKYKGIITRATENARSHVAQGKIRSEALRRKGQLRMGTAVSDALTLVIGLEENTSAR